MHEVGLRTATVIEIYHHVKSKSREGNMLGFEFIEMALSLNESLINLCS